MARQLYKTVLKSAVTDTQYQSTFMPIFSNAEAKIKKLVVFAFWTNMPKSMLVFQIMQIINQVKKDIPSDLYNREAYVNGLIASSNKIVKQYEQALHMFDIDIKQPLNKAGYRFMNAQQFKERLRSWSEVKAYPNVKDYNKQLKKFIDSVAERPFVTKEKGKKAISLWQKAELDVRYNKQIEMLETLKSENVELAWISSHADCSERCEIFQGELVSLTKHAKNPQKSYRKFGDIDKDRFVCDEIDGHKVYSLPDIIAVTDKYGYHNMIISGFNCRHSLHKYIKGSVAPKQYSEHEIKQQREIESNIRSKEREIRSLKMKLNDDIIVGDKQAVSKLRNEIKVKVQQYKQFCNSHGYAWEKYRIDVNDNNVYLRSRS